MWVLTSMNTLVYHISWSKKKRVIIVLKTNKTISNQEENPQTRKVKQACWHLSGTLAKGYRNPGRVPWTITPKPQATDNTGLLATCGFSGPQKICHTIHSSLPWYLYCLWGNTGQGRHTHTHLPAPSGGGATWSSQENTGFGVRPAFQLQPFPGLAESSWPHAGPLWSSASCKVVILYTPRGCVKIKQHFVWVALAQSLAIAGPRSAEPPALPPFDRKDGGSQKKNLHLIWPQL